MNNEVMAQAISGIDDDLVAEAFDSTIPIRKKKKQAGIFVLAACFAVVISVSLFVQKPDTPQVLAYGIVVEDEPITIASGSEIESSARIIEKNSISVPIEIRGTRNVKIEATAGTLNVSDLTDNELLYSGNSFNGQTPVSVSWTVVNPDTAQEYELCINGNSLVLKLMYDKENSSWILIKQ